MDTIETDGGRTSIQVSEKLADELYSRKNRGESYEDVIWRLIEEADAGRRTKEDIAESDSSDDNTPEEHGRTEARREPEDAVEEALADVEFPSTKDREECIEAVRAAYEYLQDHGEATMSEFVTGVMPEHPVGYDADADVEKINDPDQRNRSTWWRKVVKPGLEALPDVESPPTGASNWTDTGDSDE